ncbi:MAG: hypothetical protein COA84_13875 [Robiginitomaculum sp.]|nr:MAG: hypothetical protein COA84_13875 [Robiginitomaculum sp.]
MNFTIENDTYHDEIVVSCAENTYFNKVFHYYDENSEAAISAAKAYLDGITAGIQMFQMKMPTINISSKL